MVKSPCLMVFHAIFSHRNHHGRTPAEALGRTASALRFLPKDLWEVPELMLEAAEGTERKRTGILGRLEHLGTMGYNMR